MNLNYEKIKQKIEAGGNPWTSYSDLFLVLSVVFLLLYVVANIRSGTMSVVQQSAMRNAQREAEELRKQIKVYEVTKDEYLKSGATQDEMAVYQELVSKLNLLESETKSERDTLYKKAKDAADKYENLNRYQQMVKNIINANLIASSKVKKRDVIIEGQDKDILGLNQTVAERESQIEKNNQTIVAIQGDLEQKIKEVEWAYRSKKRSKQKMEAEIQRLKSESAQRIDALRSENTTYASQLDETRSRLQQKSKEAENLVATLSQKEADYQNTIESLQKTHDEQLARDKQALAELQNQKMSAEARAAKEKAQAEEMARREKAYQEKLAGLTGDLDKTRKNIKEMEGKYQSSIGSLKSSLGSLQKANESLKANLEALSQKEGEYQSTIAGLNKSYQDQLAKDKQALADLHSQKMSAEARAAKEKAQAEEMARRERAYQEKLAGLTGDLDKTRKNIKEMEGKYQSTVGTLQTSIGTLQKSNTELQKNLAASIQKLNEQRELANRLKANFLKAGINALVDPKTGEVTINFQDEYFDTGSSNLKPTMRSVLEKTIPVYAKSLFQDPKVAKRLMSVDIVGFASPTYRGKFVDPESLSAESRAAVNYNMDLSYQRAKTIFEYVFDTKKMSFPYQQNLLPLVKVTGRSYLATERLQGRSTANVSDDDYCQKYDCRKSQRVIIKFNLREE